MRTQVLRVVQAGVMSTAEDDDSPIDMDAPADLLLLEHVAEGQPLLEIDRRSYETGIKACAALAAMIGG